VELLSVRLGSGICLAGEVDMSSAPKLEEALRAAVEQGGPILVDVTDIRFMDSSGIRSLVKAALDLGERGCLIVHGERPQVRRVLDLARLAESVPNLHRVPHAQELGSLERSPNTEVVQAETVA
jgi:anti-sigma B factor antagonist